MHQGVQPPKFSSTADLQSVVELLTSIIDDALLNWVISLWERVGARGWGQSLVVSPRNIDRDIGSDGIEKLDNQSWAARVWLRDEGREHRPCRFLIPRRWLPC